MMQEAMMDTMIAMLGFEDERTIAFCKAVEERRPYFQLKAMFEEIMNNLEYKEEE